MDTKGAQRHPKHHSKTPWEALKREKESKESPGRSQIVELLENTVITMVLEGPQGDPKAAKGSKKVVKYHPGDPEDPQKRPRGSKRPPREPQVAPRGHTGGNMDPSNR